MQISITLEAGIFATERPTQKTIRARSTAGAHMHVSNCSRPFSFGGSLTSPFSNELVVADRTITRYCGLPSGKRAGKRERLPVAARRERQRGCMHASVSRMCFGCCQYGDGPPNPFPGDSFGWRVGGSCQALAPSVTHQSRWPDSGRKRSPRFLLEQCCCGAPCL